MKQKQFGIFVLFIAVSLVISCKKIFPQAPEIDRILDGPIEGLSEEENKRFLKGETAFNRVFTSASGLGPVFVSNSCVSCHVGDGKGHPFTTLTRFGQSDSTGNQFLMQGGPQLQHRAIPGFTAEILPAGVASSKFLPPAMTGLGFLHYVSDADILAMADPNDSDGDGISGVPNWGKVPAYVTLRDNAVAQNGKYICRFGKKAAAYDLLQQTVNAYNQDMGVVSTYEPVDPFTHQPMDPEVLNNEVLDLVFYQLTLKAPIARNQDNEQLKKGRALFDQLQCAKCHRPELKTGYSPIAALSYKTFYPYTDLLLHDMGSALDDGYTEGNAKTSEWRTPPLWGIGLSADAQGGELFLLHDGRARSLEEAIQLHGGEAANARNLFLNLNSSDQRALIEFLNSL